MSTVNQSYTIKELFSISKSVYDEAYLEGYLENAGSQKEKYIEKLEKNNKSVRRSAFITKILSAVFIIFMNLITAQTIGQFQEALPLINHINFSAYLFALTTPTVIIFGTNFLFLFTYGITSTIGVFRGTAFKLLKILPLTESDRRKIVFITFFRTIDLQLICIFLGLPIYTIIFAESLLAVFVSFIVSGINLLFYISLMVIIGSFMANKIFSYDSSSKGKNAVKIIVSVLYLITAMTIGLLFNIMGELIGGLFQASLSVGSTGSIINLILAFIFWPFSLAYLYGLSIFPIDKIMLYFDQSWFILLGFLLSVVIIYFLFRKSMRILGSVSMEKELSSGDRQNIEVSDIAVTLRSPAKAIIRKDFVFFMRNFQAIIYLFMPIILQIMGVVIMTLYYPTDTLDGLYGLTATETIYLGMSVVFLIVAVTSAENETGGLLYSLPVSTYDVYKAKKRIMLVDVLISIAVPTIILLFVTDSTRLFVFISQLTYMVIAYYSVCLGLTLYGVLFGKLREKYTLMQINLHNKNIKQIGAVVLLLIGIFVPLILTSIIGIIIDAGEVDALFFIIQLIISLMITIPIELLARKTFKKN